MFEQDSRLWPTMPVVPPALLKRIVRERGRNVKLMDGIDVPLHSNLKDRAERDAKRAMASQKSQHPERKRKAAAGSRTGSPTKKEHAVPTNQGRKRKAASEAGPSTDSPTKKKRTGPTKGVELVLLDPPCVSCAARGEPCMGLPGGACVNCRKTLKRRCSLKLAS